MAPAEGLKAGKKTKQKKDDLKDDLDKLKLEDGNWERVFSLC
jgi:hypothetical protein